MYLVEYKQIVKKKKKNTFASDGLKISSGDDDNEDSSEDTSEKE